MVFQSLNEKLTVQSTTSAHKDKTKQHISLGTTKMLPKRRKSTILRCAAIVMVALLALRYFAGDKTNIIRFGNSISGFLHTPRETEHSRGVLARDDWYNRRETPHLAVSACGESIEEAIILFKSAVMFTKSFLVIHVFCDRAEGQERLKTEFESWPSDVRARLKYNIYNMFYPADVSCEKCTRLRWKSLFKPCAAQRLFLADALPEVNSVLYVDADAVFLAPIDEIWSILFKFNSTQFVAVASDTELEKTGFYYNKSIPYFGPTGINSGVMLMNLTRMRTSTWLQSVSNSLIRYGKTHFGDQDLINIYLHNHPENGYLLTCDWNFHRQQCTKCNQATQTGVAILHSTVNAFKNDNYVAFKAIYQALKQYNLKSNNIDYDLLLHALKWSLDEMKSRNSTIQNDCYRNPSVYTKRLEGLISRG